MVRAVDPCLAVPVDQDEPVELVGFRDASAPIVLTWSPEPAPSWWQRIETHVLVTWFALNVQVGRLVVDDDGAPSMAESLSGIVFIGLLPFAFLSAVRLGQSLRPRLQRLELRGNGEVVLHRERGSERGRPRVELTEDAGGATLHVGVAESPHADRIPLREVPLEVLTSLALAAGAEDVLEKGSGSVVERVRRATLGREMGEGMAGASAPSHPEAVPEITFRGWATTLASRGSMDLQRTRRWSLAWVAGTVLASTAALVRGAPLAGWIALIGIASTTALGMAPPRKATFRLVRMPSGRVELRRRGFRREWTVGEVEDLVLAETVSGRRLIELLDADARRLVRIPTDPRALRAVRAILEAEPTSPRARVELTGAAEAVAEEEHENTPLPTLATADKRA